MRMSSRNERNEVHQRGEGESHRHPEARPPLPGWRSICLGHCRAVSATGAGHFRFPKLSHSSRTFWATAPMTARTICAHPNRQCRANFPPPRWRGPANTPGSLPPPLAQMPFHRSQILPLVSQKAPVQAGTKFFGHWAALCTSPFLSCFSGSCLSRRQKWYGFVSISIYI